MMTNTIIHCSTTVSSADCCDPPVREVCVCETTTLTTWSSPASPGTHRNLRRAPAHSRPVLLSCYCLHVNLLITTASPHNHQVLEVLCSEDGWWQDAQTAIFGAESISVLVVEVSSQPSWHLSQTGGRNRTGASLVGGCYWQVATSTRSNTQHQAQTMVK